MKPNSEPSNLQRNLTIAVCIFVIAGAGYFIVRALIPRPEPIPNAYFFDLNTKKIFIASASERAPIATPSGPFENEPAGVRLFVFSCSPCPNLNGKTLDEVKALGATVGWLERYSPEAQKKLNAGDHNPETLIEGVQIRAANGARWLAPNTREATAIRESISRLCAGLPGHVCNPD